MATRITAYQSTDGMIFNSAEECEAHEIRTKRTASILAFVESKGLNASGVATPLPKEDENADTKYSMVALGEFLLANADELVEALTVELAAKRGRRPKSAANEEKAAA